jgi:Zn-dependent protease
MNVILALASVAIMKYFIIPIASAASAQALGEVIKPMFMMLSSSVQINIVLAAFNLIPIPPLDGGRVLMGFLPDSYAYLLGRVEPFGMIIVLLLIITGIAFRSGRNGIEAAESLSLSVYRDKWGIL